VRQFVAFRPTTYWLPKTGNRSGKDRRATAALADIEGHIRGKWIARGTPHQLHGALHLRVGKNIEEGGLREAHRKRLLERVVEDRVSGFVGEVREDHGVGGLDSVYPAGEVQPSAKGQPEKHDQRARRRRPTEQREEFGRGVQLARACGW
jgi:hypothetical protein